MDAFTYFFINLGLLNFLLALVSFLLGLWLGYLIWYKYKTEAERLRKSVNSGNSASCDCAANERKINGLQSELDQCSQDKAQLSETIAKLKNNKESIAVPQVDSKPISTSSLTKDFSAQLSSGEVVKDENLGFLYTEKPQEEDDLTLIKGVAGVLKGKLNEMGVYTFKQIYSWDKKAMDEFSDRLSFKGRVERDDWLGQAERFHKEKYGE